MRPRGPRPPTLLEESLQRSYLDHSRRHLLSFPNALPYLPTSVCGKEPETPIATVGAEVPPPCSHIEDCFASKRLPWDPVADQDPPSVSPPATMMGRTLVPGVIHSEGHWRNARGQKLYVPARPKSRALDLMARLPPASPHRPPLTSSPLFSSPPLPSPSYMQQWAPTSAPTALFFFLHGLGDHSGRCAPRAPPPLFPRPALFPPRVL